MSSHTMENTPVEEDQVVETEAAGQPAEEATEAAEAAMDAAKPSTVEQLEAELAELKDQFLRAKAEHENLRKRAERDQAETRKYAITEFARDMSVVCENLYRALDSMTPDMLEGEANQNLKSLHTGVDMTRSELLRGFEKHGLKRITPARGDSFDHNQHQAVSQLEDSGVESGSIAQIIQAGYQIHDRLLQPAMVVVATSATDTKPIVDTQA